MAKSTKNNWTRTKAYQDLKRSLLEELNAAGMERLPFTDLVEQYMSLWCQLQMLNQDVEERGVYIEYQNGSSQKGITDNKSLGAAIRVGDRMDDILTTLGYKARAARAGASAVMEDDDPL